MKRETRRERGSEGGKAARGKETRRGKMEMESEESRQ